MSSASQRPVTINVNHLMHQIALVMERDQVGINELARRTGLTPGYVSMVMRGERDQTLAKALLFAHAVGLAHLSDDVR